jgi:nitrile hydratase accessory protein
LFRPDGPAGPARSGFPGNGEEPVFHEPWEAQAFSIAVALSKRGVFTWTEWAEVLAGVIADPPSSGLPYYDQWLMALEKLVTDRRLVDGAELAARREAWRAAAQATPHGEPIVLPTCRPREGREAPEKLRRRRRAAS